MLRKEIKTLAVDLSDYSCKLIRLEKEKDGVVLSCWAEFSIKKGLIDKGVILKEEDLVSQLQKYFEGVSCIRDARWVIASLPEEKSFFEIIALPSQISEQELSVAVRAEAEKYIPLPLDQVYLAYEPIDKTPEHMHIALSAIPRDIADSYLRVFKSLGLEPVFFEIETQSIGRAVIKDEYTPYPVLILDLGASRTTLIIFSGKSVRFSSTVPFSGSLFSEKIAEALGTKIEKAEKIKKEIGLLPEKGEKINEVLAPYLRDLVLKIKKHLNYYRTHSLHEHRQKGEIKKIILCGGGANLRGLPLFLEQELGIEVQLANPWINILPTKLKRRPPISLSSSLPFTTALGLAKLSLELET